MAVGVVGSDECNDSKIAYCDFSRFAGKAVFTCGSVEVNSKTALPLVSNSTGRPVGTGVRKMRGMWLWL